VKFEEEGQVVCHEIVCKKAEEINETLDECLVEERRIN
jgi:hypothetical protein